VIKEVVVACSVSLFLTAAASAQTPAGGEFRVNSFVTGRQVYARPAMEPDGDFVVVWMSNGQDGNGFGVFGQRYAASGAPRGSEFRVNTYTPGFQSDPVVAIGNKGDFVVVWMGQDNSGYGIRGRRYDSAGNPVAGEFPVNTFMTGYQFRPGLGRASDGRFVVIWTSALVDGSGDGVAARRFDAAGSPIGGEFVVNSYITGNQRFGNVAVDANGTFVAVWEELAVRDGSGSAIFGQRYNAAGARLGGEFRVNSYTTGSQVEPSVSVSPTGGFVVAWTSYAGDGSGDVMFARRFDASGNAVGNDFVVNSYTPGNQYSFRGQQVAHDSRGNFVVTWISAGQDGSVQGNFAQRFSAAGARRGVEFRVNSYITGYQRLPSVASDSVGNFVVTWDSSGQDGSDFGIFAQRFGGLFPTALDVNTAGNRVWEPGETVDVRATWRNQSGAARTFSSALVSLTGPAGATYSITDNASDYGTVANGATAPCNNCFAVAVSNPVTRPVQHWDITGVESIVPDTMGQQKPWLLHVGGSFTDVPSTNPFYAYVETLFHLGVTGGCGGTNYCPGFPTTRDQMSVFVLSAKEGAGYTPPACGTPMFADVPASNPFCRYIEELARRGVVGGCGGNNYCPTFAVLREQMAVFALRTLDPTFTPPPCGTPMFPDVPASSPFCPYIEELARRGVVSGCGGGDYCPTDLVIREQMGVFISLTFGLTLYGT
jgi:hypothetical protein